MSVDRRTFLRLAAAGLRSALLPLAACARPLGEPRDALSLPTPLAPLTTAHDFYLMSIQGAYEADLRSYRLKVGGACDRALSLSDAALRTEFTAGLSLCTLACVGNKPGGRLMSSALFRGARLRDVIDAAGVSKEATSALITGLDGFAALQSIETLRRQEALLAYDMGTTEGDLAPLPVEHGFPARLLTPGRYGYLQPKWIDSITFFEAGGYQAILDRSIPYLHGAMQLASGFSSPRGGTFPPGDLEVFGYAFGDSRPIRKVEVQVGNGRFEPAEIVWNHEEDDLPSYLWSLWQFTFRATPGKHTLTCRATYTDGDTQVTGREFPYSGGSLASITLEIRQGT